MVFFQLNKQTNTVEKTNENTMYQSINHYKSNNEKVMMIFIREIQEIIPI